MDPRTSPLVPALLRASKGYTLQVLDSGHLVPALSNPELHTAPTLAGLGHEPRMVVTPAGLGWALCASQVLEWVPCAA